MSRQKPQLSQKELARLYTKIHSKLAKEVRNSKRENELFDGKDRKAYKKFASATKELYAYVRLLDLCQTMSQEINEMHSILESIMKDNLDSKNRPN